MTELVRRARALLASLDEPERGDARRVLALLDALPGTPPDHADNVQARIELRGLAERLGRRRAEGIPFAALARSASARLSGAERDAALIDADCDAQLAAFGL